MKLLFLSILFLPFIVLAQSARQPLSIRYTGLGAYSKNFSDVFSATANQASLARLKSGGFGVYGERRFLLSELNQFSAIVAMPASASGTFALQGDYFGSANFNENQLGIAYARSITANVDAGVKINYHSIAVAGYGNASAVNFEAGTIFHLTEKLHTGFHIYNPFSSRFSKNTNEKLPAILKMGIGYEASEKFFISAEIVKQEDVPVNVNAGFQYNLQQRVLLRGGISTMTNNGFAGVGLWLGQLRIDINAAYHPQLGFTPGFLLLYKFKKEDNN